MAGLGSCPELVFGLPRPESEARVSVMKQAGEYLHARQDRVQLRQHAEVAAVPVSLKILVHLGACLALGCTQSHVQ